jgi:hypothetical protein
VDLFRAEGEAAEATSQAPFGVLEVAHA